MRRIVVVSSVLIVAVAVALVCLAWLEWAPRRTPAGQPPLTILKPDSLPAFRAAFNASAGEVRILLMLSPT